MRLFALLPLLTLACQPTPPPTAPPPEDAPPADMLAGTITLSGAWALYPMVVTWGEEFQKLHPNVKLDVSAGGAGKGMADALAGVVDLGMVSREVKPEEIAKGAWWVSVTKDAVVPTFNANHPDAALLRAHGATKEALQVLYLRKDEEVAKDWSALTGSAEKRPVHVYTRSDACGAAETFSAWLGGHQEDLQGVGVYGDPGVSEAVIRDPLGVGYNNVGFAYDAATLQPVAGLAVLPLDLDGDGAISPEEDFYGTRDSLAAAIGDGRYPSPPARALHLVGHGVPTRPEVKAFLAWVLTDGQRFVADAGYIQLPQGSLDAGLVALQAPAGP
ncbi:MAG: substrate-binding domain-containing protein [Pseudomonadota bacterium]